MSLAGYEVEVQRDEGLTTEEMTLNMGPQHPSTHGVLRFVVKADGEVMADGHALTLATSIVRLKRFPRKSATTVLCRIPIESIMFPPCSATKVGAWCVNA